MAIGTLFGGGSESSGLYGIATGSAVNPTVVNKTYFEWFIFTTSAGTPATPTGGSWNFTSNIGTAPAGWFNYISGVPLNSLWFSIAFVDSRNPLVINWSTPGLISSQSVYATAYADVFTGNGSTVAWTLSNDPVVVNNTDVSINGVTQRPTTDYTISGTTLTTTTAAPLNAIILVKYRQALPLSYYGAASNVQFTPVGALTATNVQAAIAEVVTDLALSSGSSTVGFLQAGTSAVATTVQAKLRESVSVLDFGADPTGVADSKIAFQNAITASRNVYVPTGTYSIGSNISITSVVRIFGDGVGATIIERNYSPVADTQGVFAFSGGGTIGSISNMTIRSKTGQTGGCLVSIVSGAADTLGLYRFDWVDFTTTGTSTHQYTVYMDGTAKTSSPIGIRGVDFTACSVFGGGISTMLIKGVLKFSFLGGGVYPAGGVAGSNIRFDGVAAVPTQSFTFLPADCSCPISFDRAILGIFGCGVMGAITNTANTANIYGFGYSASIQQNWSNSMFFDTSTGLKLTTSQKISNIGGAATYALEMFGNITGYSKAGSVTTIGQAGVAYSTVCPNTQTFAFDTASAKLFTIATGGGAAALVFADYKSATITLVSNPSSEFQASSTPGGGFTGIFKSVNSHTVSVKNNTGASVTYSILSAGAVTGTTDPS